MVMSHCQVVFKVSTLNLGQGAWRSLKKIYIDVVQRYGTQKLIIYILVVLRVFRQNHTYLWIQKLREDYQTDLFYSSDCFLYRKFYITLGK